MSKWKLFWQQMEHALPNLNGKVPAGPSLHRPANSFKVDCRAEAYMATLTEQQAACGQGPADLHVVNLHVLAGNVLHRNFLSNLLKKKKQNPL